jgi:hypothetical protein
MDETIQSILMAPVAMALAVVALFGLGVGILLLRRRKKRERRRAERRRRQTEMERTLRESEARHDTAPPMPLRTYPMPVVDIAEERVFDQLEDIAAHGALDHRVLPHVSLGAFLYAGDKGVTLEQERQWADVLSSREVDFLIVDGDWRPVAAIALERDALSARSDDGVEAHACESAGVAYMKVAPSGLVGAQLEDLKRHLGTAPTIAAQ